MFSDGKRELEQCTEDLRDVRSQLDEANRDLQHTRMKLGEEEFMVSQLENTENKLYSTAGEVRRQNLCIRPTQDSGQAFAVMERGPSDELDHLPNPFVSAAGHR